MYNRRQPQPDAMKAHPEATRELARIIDRGLAQPQDDAAKWYHHPVSSRHFAGVKKEKFRKAYNTALEKKYDKEVIKAAKLSLKQSPTGSTCNVSVEPTIVGENVIDEWHVNDDDEDVASPPNTTHGTELLFRDNEFRPIHMLSVWKDVETRENRCTASILLPSGAHESPGSISVCIEGTDVLHITVPWPSALTDVRFMMKSFLDGNGVPRIERSHPCIGGFFEALQGVDASAGGMRFSSTRIKLPFPVKSAVKRWLSAYEGTSAVVLIVAMEAPSLRVEESEALTIITAKRSPTSEERSSRSS